MKNLKKCGIDESMTVAVKVTCNSPDLKEKVNVIFRFADFSLGLQYSAEILQKKLRTPKNRCISMNIGTFISWG